MLLYIFCCSLQWIHSICPACKLEKTGQNWVLRSSFLFVCLGFFARFYRRGSSVAVQHPVLSLKHFIQAPSICDVMQKTFRYQTWTSGVSRLKTHLYKSDMNRISNHPAMWSGPDLRKSFMWFIAVQTSWNQSGYNQDKPKIQLLVGSLSKANVQKKTSALSSENVIKLVCPSNWSKEESTVWTGWL